MSLTLAIVEPVVLGQAMRFRAGSVEDTRAWQREARKRLFSLMMNGEPARCDLQPQVLRTEWVAGEDYRLEEISLQTLPDRSAHVWAARPNRPRGKVGAVLAIHGHGGSGEQMVRGKGLYWYGRELARMGYVVIAPDVGQHELQHTNWSLMGERTWDALRCLDYAVTLPEVDSGRLGAAGLSLGGETAMYVAALEERVQVACSSGWLTTAANMKNGHCPCFNFPGLEENFDFADIFACTAPRVLVCELGERERAPGGFPVSIGRKAFEQIRAAYASFGAERNLALSVHPGPHVFVGKDFWPRLKEALEVERPPLPDDAAAAAWHRFVDGQYSLDGTPYHWLGRHSLQLRFTVEPRPGDALELYWGAKGDEREAMVSVNGREITVNEGGHWGFRWLRLPVPTGAGGKEYDLQFYRRGERAGFLSEVRLARAAPVREKPDLGNAAHRSSLALFPAAPPGGAFMEMRSLWDSEVPLPASVSDDAARAAVFQQAEKNSRQASEAFYRCRKYVDGWLARADAQTGLIPRNFREDGNYWNGRDAAADNYPFMVLTAAMTDRALMKGRLTDMLHTEIKLTCRLDRLPEDYSFAKRAWRREQLEKEALIFEGAEYIKDGLLPITEWNGASEWSDRMVGIMEDIWKHAIIQTPHGLIPTENVEVGGDLLQACSRLFWFTGETRYLDWAIRLGDFFLLGTNHPTRDFKQLRLSDHGCEVVNGITELYVAVKYARPEKKAQYGRPLHEMMDCILEKGRNADGLLYSWFNPRTGEHSPDLCDTWGYDLDGVYTMWLVDGYEPGREAVRKALGNLKGKYVGACWGDKSADGFADSIEGALNLYNREPVASAADWIDSQTRLMWSAQKPDGVIEGWHGDGNFARTSLMYALWKTQGVTIDPWRADVRFGAVTAKRRLYLWLTASQDWSGELIFDTTRHKIHLKLPLDYARINQFPEWFAVDSNGNYEVRAGSGAGKQKTGAELIRGLSVDVGAKKTLLLEVGARS